jgi:ribosomal protein S19
VGKLCAFRAAQHSSRQPRCMRGEPRSRTLWAGPENPPGLGAPRLCRFQRGLKRKALALIKKLRKAKKEAPAGEKPEPVRTHLRNMIIIPEMIGSVVGVYNGKTFNQVRQECGWCHYLSISIIVK